jgi:hypothetical protein
MSVSLRAIKFNHRAGSLSTDAMTIRKNKTDEIHVPEWKAGVSVNAEDSRAAYAILETRGNTITIQAAFIHSGGLSENAQIRAIDVTVDPPSPSGCLGLIIKILRALWKYFFGNVLGEVKPKWVTFNMNGLSGYAEFDLANTRIAAAGVGIYNIEWQWQYRYGSKQRWRNMEISRHRIYVVLETPKSCWNQTQGSDHLPWTDVLDYSCAWARSAKTRDDAATRITKAIYGLGSSVIEYDCPNFGDTHYCYGPRFDCTKFIERMKGGEGNGQYVNCTDCATIVTTFSNVLGCDLWTSTMRGPYPNGFLLNPVLAIGGSTWQTACGWPGFSFHAVAWKNNCDVNDEVFDACLQVDGDADPMTAPHTPMWATNIKFGDCNSLNYRSRLSPTMAGGCVVCLPDPMYKIRRTIK